MEDPTTTGEDMTGRVAQRRRDLITFRRTSGGRVGGDDGDDVIQDERRGADRIRLA